MKYVSCFVASFLAFFIGGSESKDVFRFANIYGSHMVLQRAPKQATIWGFGESGQQVTLRLDKTYRTTVKSGPGNMGTWSVKLNPQKSDGPRTIVATSVVQSRRKRITLTDVLFGDVWFCSGEHNMEMPVRWASDAENTIMNATYYSNIRLFAAGEFFSKTPLRELQNIRENWTRASPNSVGGRKDAMFEKDVNEYYFSALCWNYGVQLYDQLKYPIGLVESNWNGSIEAWSSPEALTKCEVKNGTLAKDENPPNFKRSYLWNAMVHPFLRMTIYGAIWYQGETNAKHYSNPYKCMFPAMIDDWRDKWYQATGKSTDKVFPFGFVQLSSVGVSITSEERNFAQLRWDQTAGYGYVPNKRQKKVFMAVAMDLGNPYSPYRSSYPTDKKDVAIRLAQAGLVIAYGKQGYYTGPLVSEIRVKTRKTLEIVYKPNSVRVRIEVRRRKKYPAIGFEVLCQDCSIWMAAKITRYTRTSVTITPSVECPVKAVRYSWSDYPCIFKECPIYSGGLPSPPFVKNIC